ncbi:hypothetical protein LPN04_29975 [Rugamonas sp. A1-17]|nr:hypothetical protein [Rugamonas sp. A1-17]
MESDRYVYFADEAEQAQMVAKICDAIPYPSGTTVKQFLTDAGLSFTSRDVTRLVQLAETEMYARVRALASDIAKILPLNPGRSEIYDAASRLGRPVEDRNAYRRLRTALVAMPELWAEDQKFTGSKISLSDTDWAVLARVQKMLKIQKSASMSFVLRSFVIAVDAGLVDPVDIYKRSLRVKDKDILRASAVFDRLDISRVV